MAVSSIQNNHNILVVLFLSIIDVAYLDPSSYNVMHVTAWIPLLDTNEVNGCLEVISLFKTGVMVYYLFSFN